MDLLQAIILGIVQGITEFLPISSSAHLKLIPFMSGWEHHGLAFDVALHFGTLLAVMGYFRKDLMPLITGWLGTFRGGPVTGDARIAWGIFLGTFPAALAGLFFHSTIEHKLGSPVLIAIMLMVFGLLLFAADRLRRGERECDSLGWGEFLLIGIAQAVALIPGTSRSGVTMTIGLALGMSRTEAARFAFLLAIPVILLATGYEGMRLMMSPEPADWPALLTGTAVACASGWACIHFLLQLLKKTGFGVFVIYRLILGLILLWLYL